MSKLFLRGKGALTLTERDYKSQGGEGKIYVKGKTAYKIYLEPQKMIPLAKIDELALLDDVRIVRPKEVILKDTTPVGFTMDFVPDPTPLCKLFTNDFRDRNGITPETVVRLVEAMAEVIKFIHQHRCLIVDGNEMNYLVGATFNVPFFIDVDSYQTPSFPATALMQSVRDWHSACFTELSDWFSFAIVACQLFVGIHPYKGRHDGFKPADLEGRMKANVSIFNRAVRTPAAVRDLGLIPSLYRDWFVKLFEKGERLPPPGIAGLMQISAPKITTATGDLFLFSPLRQCATEVLEYRRTLGKEIITTRGSVWIDGHESRDTGQVVITPWRAIPVKGEIRNRRLLLRDLSAQTQIDFPAEAEALFVADNSFVIKSGDKLIEVALSELGNRILASPKTVWSVLPQSTQCFQGCAFQDVLGKAYFLIPLPAEIHSSLMIKPVPELDGYRILDARHEGRILLVTGFKAGVYHKFLLRFSADYGQYELRDLKTDDPSLNFTVLENGLVVLIPEEEHLELFHRDSPKVRQILSPDVRTSLRLAHDGITVVASEGNEVFRLRMKN